MRLFFLNFHAIKEEVKLKQTSKKSAFINPRIFKITYPCKTSDAEIFLFALCSTIINTVIKTFLLNVIGMTVTSMSNFTVLGTQQNFLCKVTHFGEICTGNMPVDLSPLTKVFFVKRKDNRSETF